MFNKFCLTLALICCGIANASSLPGQLALQTGDFDRARAQVEAALAQAESPALRLVLAQIALAENQLDDAQRIVADVLGSAPDNADAHALNGDIYALWASRAGLFRTGKFARSALQAYDMALSLDPHHVDALTGMIRFRNSAPRLFGGSMEQALEGARRLSRIEPVTGALETAAIYADRGNGERHREILLELTRTQPSDPRAWLQLGFEEQRERNWQTAHDYFDQARAMASGKPQHMVTLQSARYQLGRTAVLSGEHKETGVGALTDYLAGPQFSELPEFEWAHYRRALLLDKLGDGTGAQRDFARAARSDDRDLQRALRGR